MTRGAEPCLPQRIVGCHLQTGLSLRHRRRRHHAGPMFFFVRARDDLTTFLLIRRACLRWSAPRPRGRSAFKCFCNPSLGPTHLHSGRRKTVLSGFCCFSFPFLGEFGGSYFFSFRPFTFSCFSGSQTFTGLNPIIPQCAAGSERASEIPLPTLSPAEDAALQMLSHHAPSPRLLPPAPTRPAVPRGEAGGICLNLISCLQEEN